MLQLWLQRAVTHLKIIHLQRVKLLDIQDGCYITAENAGEIYGIWFREIWETFGCLDFV